MNNLISLFEVIKAMLINSVYSKRNTIVCGMHQFMVYGYTIKGDYSEK